MVLNIFLFFLFWVSIGSIFVEFLDTKTAFNPVKITDFKHYSEISMGERPMIYDTHFKFLFLFGSFFCYLFINTIKKRRKIYYYKNRLIFLEGMKKYEFYTTEGDKEILRLKRFLKLNKLNKKFWYFY